MSAMVNFTVTYVVEDNILGLPNTDLLSPSLVIKREA